jgi:uncharacterized SAM-binding protein YcdF (DUF218 family)
LSRLAIPGTLILSVALAALLARLLLTNFGRWLVVADPLEAARSILVLGGEVPYRAMEAAALYRQGWAPEVWLTRYPPKPEVLTLESLGIDVPAEHHFTRRVLEHLGVPREAILEIEPGLDTAGEVRNASARLKTNPGRNTIILVTSKTHARRVKVLWRALADPSHRAIVRYTRDDPFVPERWFLNIRDAGLVAHEFFGLLNAWAGLPLKAHRS